jgi:hypothetical protein
VQQLTTDLLDPNNPASGLLSSQADHFVCSYAYGEPNADSDIDLLVIVPQSDEPRYRRARVAYKALRGLGIPKDILVMTREEVERKKNVVSSLVCQALRQGKVLYG